MCYIVLSGIVMVWRKMDDEIEAIDASPGGRNAQSAESSPCGREGKDECSRKSVSEVRRSLVDASRRNLADVTRRSVTDPSSLIGPKLEQVDRTKLDKFIALARMLSEVHSSQHEVCCEVEEQVAYDVSLVACAMKYGKPVAALGPGTLFGETSLVNDVPRNATVSCWKNCTFLTLTRFDFDRILKQELIKAHHEKRDFLVTHISALKKLHAAKIESLLYYFKKETYPKNHAFVTQGVNSDQSMYLITSGSVEFSMQPSPKSNRPLNAQRLGILMSGGFFGPVSPKVCDREPFNVVVTSSSCEVLRLQMESLRNFPDLLVRCLRDMLYQTAARQLKNCPSFHSPGSSPKKSCNAQKAEAPSARKPRPSSSSSWTAKFLTWPTGKDRNANQGPMCKSMALKSIASPEGFSQSPSSGLSMSGSQGDLPRLMPSSRAKSDGSLSSPVACSEWKRRSPQSSPLKDSGEFSLQWSTARGGQYMAMDSCGTEVKGKMPVGTASAVFGLLRRSGMSDSRREQPTVIVGHASGRDRPGKGRYEFSTT